MHFCNSASFFSSKRQNRILSINANLYFNLSHYFTLFWSKVNWNESRCNHDYHFEIAMHFAVLLLLCDHIADSQWFFRLLLLKRILTYSLEWGSMESTRTRIQGRCKHLYPCNSRQQRRRVSMVFMQTIDRYDRFGKLPSKHKMGFLRIDNKCLSSRCAGDVKECSLQHKGMLSDWKCS